MMMSTVTALGLHPAALVRNWSGIMVGMSAISLILTPLFQSLSFFKVTAISRPSAQECVVPTMMQSPMHFCWHLQSLLLLRIPLLSLVMKTRTVRTSQPSPQISFLRLSGIHHLHLIIRKLKCPCHLQSQLLPSLPKHHQINSS